ncbi:Hypothetical predicted protein [Podarcis lilfordi]|uniref:Uncharacterized protein n=1 Tax=Podarcis lilfordi TaxID=74358 RepID=A0AA35JPQ9_9SAUR|nr:Hypothetical predicted protein [Podarcis lilfordi]
MLGHVVLPPLRTLTKTSREEEEEEGLSGKRSGLHFRNISLFFLHISNLSVTFKPIIHLGLSLIVESCSVYIGFAYDDTIIDERKSRRTHSLIEISTYAEFPQC